jgi:hypothetical protein
MSRLRVLTWHVHGSYLRYLAEADVEFVLPVRPGRPEGYGGRPAGLPPDAHAREVDANEVRTLDLDAVLYQSHRNYLVDRFEILSDAQRALPQVFLEHDPPRETPTDTRHPMDDPDGLLIHVTHFNELMWDPGRTPTTVIPHGVRVPDGVTYTGEKARGLVIVNGLADRGRRLGADVFERVRERVPLDLVGMDSERLGGLGEVPYDALPAFAAHYRFVFNPIRYTSLGLAVLEAMAVGLPIVGLATTEMPTVVGDGRSGFVHTDVAVLIEHMHDLLADADLARRLGDAARTTARQRFGIERFAADWEATLERAVAAEPRARRSPPAHDDDRSTARTTESDHRRGGTRWTSR